MADAQKPKSKMTKAERRAQQEQQRAKKAASKVQDGQHGPRLQFDDPKRLAKHTKKQMLSRTPLQKDKSVRFFSHLPQYERENSLSYQVGFASEEIHPAVLRTGSKYAEGALEGANARCIAMLHAFKEFVRDYQRPEDKEFGRDLEMKLRPQYRFLIDCRPPSFSMGNAISFLKHKITHLPPSVGDDTGKKMVIKMIDDFIQERIEFSIQVIAKFGATRVDDGDTVLVYGSSHAIEQTLLKAIDQQKEFHVIVIDSRPMFHGRMLVKMLTSKGISCSYALVNAVPYMISQANKVFLGAASVLLNGTCLASAGSALVAMNAHLRGTPVIVCCEMYKFHHRAQVDAITFNELGDPDDLISLKPQRANVLSDWRDMASLKLLNLKYDLIPDKFIRIVITEVGEIPPSAVPVVIREYMSELLFSQ